MSDIYYYGCWRESGHFLYKMEASKVYANEKPCDFPCPDYTFDGGFLPPKFTQVEGKAILVHFPAWTLLSFWDRSVDKRSNSNSNFLLRGVHTFEQAVALCKEAYPQTWERFDFDVTEWNGTAK